MCAPRNCMEQGARLPRLVALLLVLEGCLLSHGVKLATRLVAENYCRGQEAVAHISPVDGGVSLLQRMRLYTPTFHVPDNRGCSVLPIGIMVKEIESVTYELGSVEVQTSAIGPNAETTSGGFNLSFAANQTLQIKPADVMLPAKEDVGYTLQCACPPLILPAQAAADGGASVVSPANAGAALAGEGIAAQTAPTTQTVPPSTQAVQTGTLDNEADGSRTASSVFLAPESPIELKPQTNEQLTLELKETPLRPWGDRQPAASRATNAPALTADASSGGVADTGASSAIGVPAGAKAPAVALPATAQAKVQQNAVASEADARVGGTVATSSASAADAAVAGTANAGVVASQATASKSEQLPQTPEGWFWALLRGFSIASALKMACMASNVVFQVSPLPQVRSWSKWCSTGEVDAAPYVAVCVGGWQWCYYGIFAWLVTGRDGFLILVHSNILGAVLGTYYVRTFWQNCLSTYALEDLIKYLKMAVLLAVAQIVIVVSVSVGWSLLLAGITASLCSVLTSLALLVSVPKVIATGNSAPIPGPIVFAGFFSSFCWFCCGIMLGDKCILFPNGVFIGVAFLCLYLKLRYPSRGDCDDLEDKADFEGSRCAGTGSTS